MHYDDAKFTSWSGPRVVAASPHSELYQINVNAASARLACHLLRNGNRRWYSLRGDPDSGVFVCRIGGGVCDAFNANKLCYALCKII